MSTKQPTGSYDVNADEPDLLRVMGPKLLLLFIVGDILGTGVYALTGSVAGEVGGAAWAPFLVAFFVATITAFSYLELVTKYPAGRRRGALHAQGVRDPLRHLPGGLHRDVLRHHAARRRRATPSRASSTTGSTWGSRSAGSALMLVALGFMALVAAVNFRGVGESVKANVVLTMVELSGLLLIIFIGLCAVTQGNADFSRVVVFESSDDRSVFFAVTAATSLAFFAMVGFEDSVNMAEECTDPVRDFPKMMLTGLGITGTIYVLVSITAVALVPVGDLTNPDKGQALTQVVAAGAPDLPTSTRSSRSSACSRWPTPR